MEACIILQNLILPIEVSYVLSIKNFKHCGVRLSLYENGAYCQSHAIYMFNINAAHKCTDREIMRNLTPKKQLKT